jgi:hypothetical protein
MAGRKHDRSTRLITPPDPAEDDGKHECASSTWCQAAARDGDEWRGARTFQVYCAACTGRIGGCLEELPAAWDRLQAVIGERPRTGRAVRVPPGSRVLIRLEIDALQRLMGWVLGSWHERVAMVDRLTPPDMDAAIHHSREAVVKAVACLHPDRVNALLALPLEPMGRVMYDPGEAEEWLALIDPQETGVVTVSGEAYMTPRLSGLHAGKEILELHYRARRILGEIRTRPESFDGIPCRECEEMALEHAEPPSDPEEEAKHSRCAACRHEMTREEFSQWTAMYRKWAEAVPGLACRRCQKGNCGQCAWKACDCRARAHTPRRDAAA